MQCVKKNVVSLIRSEENAGAAAWEAPDILDSQSEPEEPELSEEEKIRLQAKEEGYQEGLAQGHAEGFEQGKQEGFQTGHAEATQQVTAEGQAQQEQIQQQAEGVLSELEALANALHHPLESQLDETVNEAIATLVVQIAEKVIKQELSIHPEHIVGVVNELFQQLPMTDREVRFHLHPEDKALLESGVQLTAGGFDWKLEEDEAVTRGGCHVESHNFSADEQVEQRLDQAVKQVFGEVALGQPPTPAVETEVTETEAEAAKAEATDEVEPSAAEEVQSTEPPVEEMESPEAQG